MQWKPNPHNGGAVLHCDGFTISYAAYAIDSLQAIDFPEEGGTALINERDGKRGICLILNGNWREEYEAIAHKGYEACRAFYDEKKAEHRSRFSEDDDAGITDKEARIIMEAYLSGRLFG